MIDKICSYLTDQIRKKMPEIDDERAEIINYGLQNIIGEIPKIFIIIGLAFILGIGKLALISFLVILPYRTFSGGFHLHTHIGCILGTSLFYYGNVFLSKYIVYGNPVIKYIVIAAIWIFGIIMIKMYAPADTENVPILRKKDRMQKQILSFLTFTLTLVIAVFVKDNTISNMMIFGMLFQTLTITKLAYRLTNNKYGYELYQQEKVAENNY